MKHYANAGKQEEIKNLLTPFNDARNKSVVFPSDQLNMSKKEILLHCDDNFTNQWDLSPDEFIRRNKLPSRLKRLNNNAVRQSS